MARLAESVIESIKREIDAMTEPAKKTSEPMDIRLPSNVKAKLKKASALTGM